MGGVDRGTFETLVPCQFISFTLPNPNANPSNESRSTSRPYGGDFLRIAVLDSPLQIIPSEALRIAAMLVPENREDDWIFSTESGHLQLLFNSPGICRLILIGNLPRECCSDYYNRNEVDKLSTAYRTKLEESLIPLLLALSPKSKSTTTLPLQIPLFVTYQDNVIRSVLVERCVGGRVGEMCVEDVEIEIDESYNTTTTSPSPSPSPSPSSLVEFRRRLRFKRMPNLIQTQIRILPTSDETETVFGQGKVQFQPRTGVLVHPYLPPMVASLSLIAPYLEDRLQSGSRPRVLCVGVGGGALLSFLDTHFRFEVMGVEADETVLRVATHYFGLVDDAKFLRVCVGDGIEIIHKFARRLHNSSSSYGNADVETDRCLDVFDGCYSLMDVIMVDLDSSDATNGVSAPPLEFLQKSVLFAAKLALHTLGILVINVIPPSSSFYDYLIHEFHQVFSELYEIDVGNGENFVLIAAPSPVKVVLNGHGSSILDKLKLLISGAYLDCIRKI